MKKKIFSLLVIAVMLFGLLFVFAGCGDDEENTESNKDNNAKSSQVENKKDNDDNRADDDDDDYEDNDDVRGSYKSNTIKSNDNTIGENNTTNDSNTSNKNVVKIIGTNSELSKLAGQMQGMSYGDIKVEIEYDKSKEKVLSMKLSMSMEVTNSQMLSALDSIDLNSLFESSLSNQKGLKNAKTERVGNTIYFTADMDVEEAMADLGDGKNTISLEELKEGMTESSFVVTVEE